MIKVILNSRKEIYNATDEQVDFIKSQLTLPNPAYISALKYSPYANVKIPKTIAYYEYVDGGISVPRGYEVPFEYEVIEDNRFENKIRYPKLKVVPRDMQIEAIEAFSENTDSMLISPTGSGKSVMALAIASKIKNKALIIVHKDDLVFGWMDDSKKCFGLLTGQIGLIKAHTYRIGKWITISTIQTLSKLPEEKLQELYKEFGVIICDELHHSPSNTWGIINKFPAKYRIGITATAMRNDGLGEVMNFYFGEPCFVYKESETNKDIIPPSKVLVKRKIAGTIFNPSEKYVDTRTGNELNGIYDNGVYYKISELSEARLAYLLSAKKLKRKPMDYMQARKTIQNDEHFMKQLCNDIELEFKHGKSCIVFCFEKEHCRDIENFLRQKIPSDKIQLYYGDSKESKTDMKKKAESKEALITIATYSIATEGTNIRSWERIFFTIGPGNAKDTIQAIGRGRRTFAGKNDLIVYDYVFPNVKGIRNHYAKREKVYKEIGFKIH